MTQSAILLLLVSLGVVVFVCLAAAKWVLPRFRVRKSEQERRRRMFINNHGRLRDAYVTEVRDDLIVYSYTVSGVEYSTSQDISGLHAYLPGEIESLIGPAAIKYTPHNPFNSIVLCESWCGLRAQEGKKSSSGGD